MVPIEGAQEAGGVAGGGATEEEAGHLQPSSQHGQRETSYLPIRKGYVNVI